jgi:hypothetical protein
MKLIDNLCCENKHSGHSGDCVPLSILKKTVLSTLDFLIFKSVENAEVGDTIKEEEEEPRGEGGC